jgi:hypothetical protein
MNKHDKQERSEYGTKKQRQEVAQDLQDFSKKLKEFPVDKDEFIEKLRVNYGKKWDRMVIEELKNGRVINCCYPTMEYLDHIESLAYTQSKQLIKQHNLIHGAECGYGSLKEQGYWQGAEHAEKHYKKKIDKLEKQLESVRSAIRERIKYYSKLRKDTKYPHWGDMARWAELIKELQEIKSLTGKEV